MAQLSTLGRLVFMLKLIIMSLCIVGAIKVRGDELLVTQSGDYTSKDKMVSISVAGSAKDHIKLHIVFKSHIQVPSAGGDVEVTSSTQVDDLPVKPDRWAFCISKENDVWFYDGEGAFTKVHNMPDRIQTLKSCSEPNLGDQAPEMMKKWIKNP